MEEDKKYHPRVFTVQQIIARAASQQRDKDEGLVRTGRISNQRYQELQIMRYALNYKIGGDLQ